MATHSMIKEQLIQRHIQCIDQLETEYNNFISTLLAKKKKIMINMQQQFYRQMECIHAFEKTFNTTTNKQNEQSFDCISLLSMFLSNNTSFTSSITIQDNQTTNAPKQTFIKIENMNTIPT
eukprot:424231_1